jgi:hypothetical protein
MKSTKTLPIIVIFTLFIGLCELNAQSNWEGGIRFGNRWSADFTIPMQSVRFHPSVYFDRFGIGGYFDWMFAISNGPQGLKLYPGLGPEVWFGNNKNNDVDFDIAGNFGIEYSFDIPLTIGFDWRPGFRITDNMKWKSSNWGFMARFRFGGGSKLVRTNSNFKSIY